ncbi:Insect cuticle protein [Trinorchestia longiramus]|nr:Insect cuticle protein [Trinorchestia longiramus]
MALLTKVLLCCLLLSTARESQATKTKSEKKEDDIFDFFDGDDEFFSESNDFALVSDKDNNERSKEKKVRDDDDDYKFGGHDFYGVPSNKDAMYGPFSFLTDELRPKLPKIPDPPKRKYRPTTTTKAPRPVLITTRQPPPPPPPPPPQPPLPPPQPQPTSAPAKQESQRIPNKQPGRPYAFAYGVNDANSGTSFKQAESSDGQGGTTGQYKVHLPDGRIQTVNYVADKNGYQANILYDGETRVPPKKQNEQPQSKPYHPPSPASSLQPQNPLPQQQEQNIGLNHGQNLYGPRTPSRRNQHDEPNPTRSQVTEANDKKEIVPETSLKSNQYNVLTDKVVEATPRKIPEEESQKKPIINQPRDDDRSLVNQPGPPYHPQPTSDNQNHQTILTQKIELQPGVELASASLNEEPQVIQADNEQAKTSSKSQSTSSLKKEGERGFKYSTEIYQDVLNPSDSLESHTDKSVRAAEQHITNIPQKENNPQNQVLLSRTLVPPKLPAPEPSTFAPSVSTTITTITTSATTTLTPLTTTILPTNNMITTTLPNFSSTENSGNNFNGINHAASENQQQIPHQIVQLSLGSLPGDDSPRYNQNYHKTSTASVPSPSSARPKHPPKNMGTITGAKRIIETTQATPHTSPKILKLPLTRSTTQKPAVQSTKLRRPTQQNLNVLPGQSSSAQPKVPFRKASTPNSRSPQNYRVDLLKPINVSPGPAFTTTHQPRSTPVLAPHGQFGTRLHQGPVAKQEAVRAKTSTQTKYISRKPRHITQGSNTSEAQLDTTLNQIKSTQEPRSLLLPVAKNLGILEKTQKSATPQTNIISPGQYTERPVIHISSTLPAKYRTLKPKLTKKVPVFDQQNLPTGKQKMSRAIRRGKKINDIKRRGQTTVISESNGEYVSFIAGPVSVTSQPPTEIYSDKLKLEYTSEKSSTILPMTTPPLESHPNPNTKLKEDQKNLGPTFVQHRQEKVPVTRIRKRREVPNNLLSPKIQSRAHASPQGEGMLPQLGRRESTARPIF